MTSPVPSPEDLLAHRDFVRAIAGAVLGADDRVNDVEQETWLAALRHAPGVRSIRSWLGTVSRNRALRELRDASRRSERDRRASEHRPEGSPDPAAIIEVEETHRRLLDALLSIDEPARTTLLLRYYESLSPPDVADRMGVPLETVRTRLRRGLVRLRRTFVERDTRAGGRGHPALLSLAQWPAEPTAVVIGGIAVKKLVCVLVLVLLFVGGAGAIHLWLDSVAGDSERASELEVGAADHAATLEPRVPLHADAQEPAAPPRPISAFGRVVDESGNSIPGAEVRAIDYSGARFFSRHIASVPDAVTDTEGRFELRSLGHGWIKVTAKRFVGNVTSIAGPAVPTHVVLKSPEGRIQGVVRAHAGAALSGAWVHVFRIDGPARAWGRTGADGRFDIPFVADGPIYAAAWAPGHLELRRVPLPLPDARGVRSIEIELERGFRVRGRVIDKSTGAPFEGAEILSYERFGPVPLTDANGAFDFLATARMPFLRAEPPGYAGGRGDLTFDADGNATSSTIEIAPLPKATGTVVDAEGEPIEGALVGLGGARTVTGPDGAFTIRGLDAVLFAFHGRHGLAAVRMEGAGPFVVSFASSSRLRGRVVDADDRPVSGATLVATPTSKKVTLLGSGLGSLRLSSGVGVTGPDGRFETIALPAGECRLTAIPPSGMVAHRAGIDVKNPVEADVELSLERGATLHGRVEGRDGRPVRGAVVEVHIEGDSNIWFYSFRPRTISDAEGRFALRGLPRRTASIGVGAEGFRPFRRSMTPGTEPLEVVLVPRKRAHVRITENPPPAGAELMALFDGGSGGGSAFYVNGEVVVIVHHEPAKTVRLEWRGRASEEIPIAFDAGAHEMRASVALPAPHATVVDVAPAMAATPVAVDEAFGKVTGRVAPVPPGGFFGVLVFTEGSNTTVAQDGTFDMRLAPGRTSLWCGTFEAKGPNRAITVEAGKTIELELTPPESGGSIRGRVVTSDGVGIGRLSLTARRADKFGAVVFPIETGANGAFALHYLVGDAYRISGSDPRGQCDRTVETGTLDASVVFMRNGTLRGLVTGDLPKDPQRIRIQIERADLPEGKTWSATASLQVDKRGFYFEQRIPPGRYRFTLPVPPRPAFVPPGAELKQYAKLRFARTPSEVRVGEGAVATRVHLEVNEVR